MMQQYKQDVKHSYATSHATGLAERTLALLGRASRYDGDKYDDPCEVYIWPQLLALEEYLKASNVGDAAALDARVAIIDALVALLQAAQRNFDPALHSAYLIERGCVAALLREADMGAIGVRA